MLMKKIFGIGASIASWKIYLTYILCLKDIWTMISIFIEEGTRTDILYEDSYSGFGYFIGRTFLS